MTELLPPSRGIRLTEVLVEDQSVQVRLTTTTPTALCPDCALPSSSVHSHYQRQLADLPWGPLAVRLQLFVRKFVCRHVSCARRIFTERLPDLAAPYARQTLRLVNALQAIGVDEWAWRRGHRYGTILADLLTHRVVDLLPDRSAASLAAWLAQHPTITAVCRDRSDLYADGIRRGAPEAVQVVDRFHLVQNLRQALEAVLLDRRPALQAAAVCTAIALTPVDRPVPGLLMYRGRRRSPKPAPPVERTPRVSRWVGIYETIHRLAAQGTPVTTVARRLGISRPTVYAYLRRDSPPGPRRFQWRPSARVLTPYLPYLIRRWRESGADSMQLWREIRAFGYAHSARTVGRFITRLRRAADVGDPPEPQGTPYTRAKGPSARMVSYTLICPPAERSREAQMYLDQLCAMEAGIARAYGLSQGFLAMVWERQGAHLKDWMAEAMHSGVEALARFARGLQEDLAAVTAGLTLTWSNGVTEGHVHRLKLVKRQGYGRAGFALLRQRVLQAA
jgi:transposase